MPYTMATRKILSSAAASAPATTAALTTPTVSTRSIMQAGPAAQQLASVAQQASGMTFEQLLQAKAQAAAAANQGHTGAMADDAAAHVILTDPAPGESDEIRATLPSGDTVTNGEIRAFYVKFYNDLGAKLAAGTKVMTSE